MGWESVSNFDSPVAKAFVLSAEVPCFLSSVDQVHSIPVQQMGNYQEYLKKMPASLREIETQPARLHMFGNPFKVNKVSQFLIFGNLGGGLFSQTDKH